MFFPRPIRTPRPPRKQRAQRFQWRTGASMRPHLAAHPEREIATPDVRRLTWECAACDLIRSFGKIAILVTPGTALADCLASAHDHNETRHPRRFARSQHFQAPIPAEIRERVAS